MRLNPLVAATALVLTLIPSFLEAQELFFVGVGVVNQRRFVSGDPYTHAEDTEVSKNSRTFSFGIALKFPSIFRVELINVSATRLKPETSDDLAIFSVNVLVMPKFGSLQPYGALGYGLLMTPGGPGRRRFSPGGPGLGGAVMAGGGVLCWLSPHLGVRGDVRKPIVIGDSRHKFFRVTAELVARL